MRLIVSNRYSLAVHICHVRPSPFRRCRSTGFDIGRKAWQNRFMKIKWGIISTARVARRRFLPALSASQRSRLVAVASREKNRADEFAAGCGSRGCGSYEELLEDKEIQAVYIPVPNSLHYRWALAAIRAGKHVLCEKPLALSAGEVEKLGAEADRNGVVLLEATAYLFHPQALRLLKMIREGVIGRPGLIRAHYTFTLPADRSNIRWARELGGGALWDIGCYPVSFCRAVAGTASREAWASRIESDSGVDVFTAGGLRFPGDLIATVECGYNLPYRVGAEVVGEKGRILVANPWSPDVDGKSSGLKLVGLDDRETRIETEKKNPYLCEIEAMEEAVLDGEEPAYSWKTARDNIATIEAMRESAESGKTVALNGRGVSGESD